MSKSDNENKPHLPGIRQSGHDAEEGRYLAEALIDAAREGMLVLSPDLIVQSANTSFYSMFEVGETETKGKLIYELGNGQWNILELRRLLEQVLPHNSVMNGFEVTHTFEELVERTMLLNTSRIDHPKLIVLATEDITARRQAEEALEHLNKTFEQRVSERTRTVQQLASVLTLAESRERHRIAQLLHDELQQQLHAVQFALHDALNPPAQPQSDSEAKEVRLQEAYDLLRSAIVMSRGLTTDLSPTVLRHEGLIEALHWLATRMQELHGLQVNLRVAKELPLPHEALRVLLFQIVRELLFNVVKHAGVSEATVTLRQEAGTLEIEVADQGQGFDPAHLESTISKETGLGLASIQNRLEFFGGGLEVLSAPGEGSSFTIVLPTASLTLS